MRIRFALSGALLLLLGSYVFAQEITATILGTVTDPSGAAVSGATIIVVNTDQAIVLRRLTTSASGPCSQPVAKVQKRRCGKRKTRFWTNRRQPLPNRVTSELPVIRPESAVQARCR